MLYIEKPRVNITGPISPKRVDVSPSKVPYPMESLSSNEPDCSADVTRRDPGTVDYSNRLGRQMSPVSQWQDTNLAMNSPVISGDIPKENIENYMMDYNIDEEILKNYLKNTNKAMKDQSIDHLKLLAEFYSIDQ